MTEKKTKAKAKADTETPAPQQKGVLPVTIAANPLRQQLLLRANPSNKNPVWLGGQENEGTPLFPGEKITLTTTDALPLVGEAGDWCYVAELVTVPPLSRPEDNQP